MNDVSRFEKAVSLLKQGQRLVVHECSICDYPCAFNMSGDKLYYDSGCDCVRYTNNSPRDVEELHFYTKQDGYAKKWGL